MKIYLRGRPVFLNRTRILPAALDPTRLGIADGFDYLATLVVVADKPGDWNELVGIMNADLAAMPTIRAWASRLAESGCVVKLLARTAFDMTHAQTALWKRARQMALGFSEVDLRKY